MSDQLIIAQLIGWCAVIISLSIYQYNKRSRMLGLSICSTVLYAIHFIMLGAYTGAAMNLVATARSYVYLKTKPIKRHRWILFSFIGIALIAGALTWQGPLSLLPTISSVSGAFAAWHSNPKYMRRWAMVGPPLWFTYNALVGSYPGMFIEVIILSSNLLGQYRFDHRHATHNHHMVRLKQAHP